MKTKKAEYSGWVKAGGQVVAKAGDEVLPALKISRTLVAALDGVGTVSGAICRGRHKPHQPFRSHGPSL
jgi:hypothetical protein